MQFLGTTRINHEGRLLIPKNIRDLYHLEPPKKIELFYKDHGIYVMTNIKNTQKGIIRTINWQGRLTIPTRYRQKLSWEKDNIIELLYVDSTSFFLRGDHRVCTFCLKSYTDMVMIYDKYICDDCLQTALGKKYMINQTTSFKNCVTDLD
ncbi:hypothetical protein GCM10011391_09460 [Pullulanibacillus camelliae]|uniref:SpoVT-AbrB domain-containing protein n=1 Tax=Pullulanibacillus camelliae TaxID=1707096 RepID=A0A8J2VPD1_9BACL|nr:hypothetical protein [Pullulanibacillus camelliae]GGE32916.1 hypothetical protein GCM10011391_09460 [Pullulanibacillus camelliae]